MARPVTTAVMSARVLLAELNRPDSKSLAGGKANTTDEQAIAPLLVPTISTRIRYEIHNQSAGRSLLRRALII